MGGFFPSSGQGGKKGLAAVLDLKGASHQVGTPVNREPRLAQGCLFFSPG
jgi:hypothetical protein